MNECEFLTWSQKMPELDQGRSKDYLPVVKEDGGGLQGMSRSRGALEGDRKCCADFLFYMNNF